MSTLQIPINTESLFEPPLTSREAAPFLRVHFKTPERMARAGAVPAIKKGKSWMFRLSRLSAWIDQELESKAVRAKENCRRAMNHVTRHNVARSKESSTDGAHDRQLRGYVTPATLLASLGEASQSLPSDFHG